MDGENKGNPYFLMDDLGGKTNPIFGSTPICPNDSDNSDQPEKLFGTYWGCIAFTWKVGVLILEGSNFNPRKGPNPRNPRNPVVFV